MKNHQFTKVGHKRGRKGTKESQNSQKAIHNMAYISSYVLIITLNINRLVSTIKSQSDWIDRKDLTTCFPQETHFSFKEKHKPKVKEKKKYSMHASENQKYK